MKLPTDPPLTIRVLWVYVACTFTFVALLLELQAGHQIWSDVILPAYLVAMGTVPLLAIYTLFRRIKVHLLELLFIPIVATLPLSCSLYGNRERILSGVWVNFFEGVGLGAITFSGAVLGLSWANRLAISKGWLRLILMFLGTTICISFRESIRDSGPWPFWMSEPIQLFPMFLFLLEWKAQKAAHAASVTAAEGNAALLELLQNRRKFQYACWWLSMGILGWYLSYGIFSRQTRRLIVPGSILALTVSLIALIRAPRCGRRLETWAFSSITIQFIWLQILRL